jgi:hypothetical protein
LRAYLEVGAREYQRDERDRVDTEVARRFQPNSRLARVRLGQIV